ncbi:STE20-like serine/threonine-protein kinase isoform X2 [Dysidea avara]
MIIKDREGRIDHVPGPHEAFLNPLEVESISVRNAIKLDANHTLVVYKQNEEHIERRIVSGPIVFVPGPQEWLHQFEWHGADRSDPGHWTPKGNQFTELLHVPNHFYYNVRDVRTNDDTMITVKLMVFYELADIETMLNYTHDPIADFLNGATSDMISFASQMSYEEFLNQSHQLSKIESYSQLTTRAEKIGFRITKVVYRGYQASSTLQNTHDDAIMKRMQLKLYGETEEQEQVLAEFKLKREMQRTKLNQEAERAIQEFSQKTEALKREHELEMESLVHEAQLKKEDVETQIQLDSERADNEHTLDYYKQLKQLGVDMTKYLVHLQPTYKPEKEIFVGPVMHHQVTTI